VQTHGIIGAAEAASGVPTLGLSAPSAATAASRLKAVMGQNVDPVAVAKELQVAFAEIKAEQRAANLTGASEGVNLSRIEVNVANATKGTPEYNILNAPPPNSQIKLSNGTEFKTNTSGYVDEITYTPALDKGVRDARQTAVGKEGLPTDVGGHIQACSLGGTCDRFNLFPQDGSFNNTFYKRWENEIKGALKNGDQVGPVTVRFSRTDPASPRPDSLIIDYSVNGVPKQRFFENKAGK
jgi:filamentous hemagglutinin